MNRLDLLALLPARRRRAIVTRLGVAALVLLALIAVLDRPLGQAGAGTIDFELAGTPERAAEITADWERAGQLERAALIDGLDYLFALIYGLALAAGCMVAGVHWRAEWRDGVARAGVVCAVLALSATLLDWTENTALAASLLSEPRAPWPQLALAAAVPKFAFSTVALIYCIASWVVIGRARPGRRRR